MKSATVNELKKELSTLNAKEVGELCLRLARFKKENKELLTYLLFEAHNEQGYIASVKEEIDKGFAGINQNNLYYVKKSLRKILRNANKFLRYSGSKTTAADVLIYYCKKLKESGIPYHKSQMILNIYQGQIKKIQKIVGELHEDLQYDYLPELKKLKP
ncbi:MAG TPA: hypothetical protein VD905_20670 [Flavobacteriales bacterium]|nr:hypothetical protein [Flavobacteriales bacterium]